jgi:small subunit ribosomal protein S20
VKVGDFATADSEASVTAKKFDRAASKNIVHKNTASRMKSRLAKFIKAAKAAAKSN